MASRDLWAARRIFQRRPVPSTAAFEYAAPDVRPAPAQRSGRRRRTVTVTAFGSFWSGTAGVIMGTAAYMSPEQARGQLVDKRADIWSFGVVLYELLTGDQLFDGGTVSDTLAAVLRQDLNLEGVPYRFHRLLAKCLTRDPRQRLRDISGARLLLEERSTQTPVPAAHPRIARWPFAIAATATLAAFILAVALWRGSAPRLPQPLIRLDLLLEEDTPLARSQNTSMFALSPDGMHLAVTFRGKDGKIRLGLRTLDQRQVTPLPGAEDASAPFFSPDGQWIGFTSGTDLKKISINGGTPVTLGDASSVRGASWAADGNIYVTGQGSSGPIYRIPSSGGTRVPVTKLVGNERTHRWPQALPGGQAVLFTSHISTTVGTYDEAKVDVVLVKTGERKNLVHGAFGAHFLPISGERGYLLYMQKNTVLAAPFNVQRLAITGAAIPVLTDVDSSARGGGDFAFSSTGAFVYREGHGGREWPLMWLDADGKLTSLHSVPGGYYGLRFSPDGKRLAYSASNGHGSDIWVDDLDRDSVSRLTFLPEASQPPVWSPDGKGIFFNSRNQNNPGLCWIPADGSGEPLRLLDDKLLGAPFPSSVSPDGRMLAFQVFSPVRRYDIYTAVIGRDSAGRPQLGTPNLFVGTPFSEVDAAFSPDGRWLAYSSDETGRTEIYVRQFPGPGGRWQVSTSGGEMPVWSRAGRELFFRDSEQRIQVVDCTASDGSFRVGKPRLWSTIHAMNLANLWTYDVAPDGKRLAIIPSTVPGEKDGPATNLVFLLNFPDELRRRIAEGR